MPNNKAKLTTDTKNTRKRQQENGSQTDEDSPAGGHCCDASKMAEISAKFDKSLQVVAEFDAVKSRMTHLEEENKQSKLVSGNTAMEIKDLKTTMVYAYSEAGTKVGPDQLGPPVRVGPTRINSDRLGT